MGVRHQRFRQRNLRMGLPRPERFLLLRKMTDLFIEHEKLETTWHKAKALKVWSEPMITWARKIKYDQTNDHGIV